MAPLKKTSLLRSLLAIGGMALATLLLSGKRRKRSSLARWGRRLGIA
jgi:hypothetical protein